MNQLKHLQRMYGFLLLCLFTVIWCSPCIVTGQSIETEIIASSGENVEVWSSDLLLSWTIGESVVESYTDGSILLVQGYHQPAMKITPLIAVSGFKDIISVYPNPATDFIVISLKKNAAEHPIEKVKILLQDLGGRLVHQAEFASREHRIDVQLLANGMYILRLMNAEDNSFIGSYTIEKLK
ncbi:MAG: T9SS type A sorting domain-containing protein [Bacteroidota bacterium]